MTLSCHIGCLIILCHLIHTQCTYPSTHAFHLTLPFSMHSLLLVLFPLGQIDMVFEVSPSAAETQTRVEALVSQIAATLLSGILAALWCGLICCGLEWCGVGRCQLFGWCMVMHHGNLSLHFVDILSQNLILIWQHILLSHLLRIILSRYSCPDLTSLDLTWLFVFLSVSLLSILM